MQKYLYVVSLWCLLLFSSWQAHGATIAYGTPNQTPELQFFKASDPAIRYVGRIDFSNPDKPRFWNPGVYLYLNFKGNSCKVIVEDQMNYGVMHNYLEIIIDGQPRRIRLNQLTDTIEVVAGLSGDTHHLVICKDTESNIGYITIAGILSQQLLPQPRSKGAKKLIECFGDSITCGASSDLSGIPCGGGRWEDQHNCYMSYGPRLARLLDADWIITAVSGIGLMHSCCDLKTTLPEVYDKLALSQDSIPWDFNSYQPDLATICLGQNDGIQDLDSFCAHYVNFVSKLRQLYPSTTLLLLTSPMADPQLNGWLQKALVQVENQLKQNGLSNIYHYFFKARYDKGCDSHPTTAEHQQIAAELLPYIEKIKHWNT